jgi:DNA-binding NarL/FixJ family response regulator
MSNYACPIITYKPYYFTSTQEEIQRAKRLHAQGLSAPEIAFTLCCSASRIRAYLQS